MEVGWCCGAVEVGLGVVLGVVFGEVGEVEVVSEEVEFWGWGLSYFVLAVRCSQQVSF